MSMAIKYGMMKKAKGACPGEDCPGCAKCATVTESPEKKMAEGGLVDRIMSARKGETADEKPADFDAMDDMTIPDDADYTGANSGDMLGNEAMDENDADLIRRIMRSRAKKDTMPRTA